MPPSINLSTSSFFPNTEMGFRMAAEHGYDGVEVMVNHDRNSQTVEAVQSPVGHLRHADPLGARALPGGEPARVGLQPRDQAAALGGDGDRRRGRDVVVVHPPFRWQRDFAATFAALVDELHQAEEGRPSPWRTCTRLRPWAGS